jgi:hypothetical protein
MVTSATKSPPASMGNWIDLLKPPPLDRDNSSSTAPGSASASVRACGYRNSTDRMVILRCCGPDQFYLERVVFPFEVLTFQCPPAAEVEVWTHGLGGPDLLETLRIEDLVIDAEAIAAVTTQPMLEGALSANPWLQAG